MKEVKVFFGEDSALNKGYKPNERGVNRIDFRKKFQHMLPPIEVISEYEALYPGVLDRLIKIAEKEQSAKHALDVQELESRMKAIKRGQNFGIIALLALCVVTIFIGILGETTMHAVLFFVLGVFPLYLVSLMSYRKLNKLDGGYKEDRYRFDKKRTSYIDRNRRRV